MSIATICVAYYAIVLYFDLVFALNFSETMSQGGEFIPSQYAWFIKDLSKNHNDSALASLIGFTVYVPPILLILKKVR